MSKPHDFDTDLARGQDVELLLDEYFEPKYLISKATPAEQRQGIDRFFICRETGEERKIDYKADWQAAHTGNVFIEATSVDVAHKGGWALTSRADVILYFLPQPRKLFTLFVDTIREHLKDWLLRYPLRDAQNKGYCSSGICVPLGEIWRVAESVDTVENVTLLEQLRRARLKM